MKMETKIKTVASMNDFNCSTSQRLNNSTSQQFNKLASHSLTNSSTHLLENPIIQVKHLSKRYQIGMDRTYKTFCESVTDTIKSPLKRLKSFSRQEEVFWALKDINFEVFPGEVVGIIGRNGAGKTTLLKILSRITHPTEGEIILRGRVASLLEVGTGFHPELTGRENIYFNGAILGMTKQEIEDKFDEIVEFSGVKEFLDTPLKRYSSGMQVRLAFAVAAHLEPEILVVDEVLAVGDAEFQKKCLGKMKDVAAGGRTVLFVSHNMAAMSSLTQSCLCLESGCIVDQGETDAVIRNYLSRFSEQTSDQGWTDLALAPHVAGHREVAVLEWVRMINSQGKQAGTFFEAEPIGIEIGFSVKEPVRSIELAYSVKPMDNTPLFMSPSGQCEAVLSKGQYTISSVIEPNHLQAGVYALGLVIFVGGQKEDVVTPALQFSIEPQLSPDDNPFYLKWSKGYFFRFDYEWGKIMPYEETSDRHVKEENI
jgi:lipopolysaccharide transport system ATP-binding protein